MPRPCEKRCGYCGGAGRVEVGEIVPREEICPICEGFGFVRVPSNYVQCPDCNGTGKKDVGEIFHRWVRCKRCKGTGWAKPPMPYT